MPFPATGNDPIASERHREPDQLQLRFFALLEGYGRNAPERALWRELLNLALETQQRFDVGGHTVRAADVHHVALAVYMRANNAGVIEEFSLPLLAADTRQSERTVRAAVKALNALGVFRSTRPSRRKPAVHRMNLGGLDWPAVRARASASPAQRAGLSAAHCAGLKGYTEGLPLVPPDRDQERRGGGGIGTGEPDRRRRPADPASEQQIGMLMQLQRQHLLPGERTTEEEARGMTRAEISAKLTELEALEARRGRVPTREELRRIREAKRWGRA